MRFTHLVLGVAVSMTLAGAAFAQPTKTNIPGCGPAQGATFQAELAARQNALAAARGDLQTARTALATLTAKYHQADCKPGMAACVRKWRAT